MIEEEMGLGLVQVEKFLGWSASIVGPGMVSELAGPSGLTTEQVSALKDANKFDLDLYAFAVVRLSLAYPHRIKIKDPRAFFVGALSHNIKESVQGVTFF